MLPEWMREKPDIVEKKDLTRTRSNRYLSKTLRQLKKVVFYQLMNEEYADRQGWWQSLDPRVKLLSILALIIVAGITRKPGVLFGIWMVIVLIMRSSHLPVLALQKYIWCFIPLLTFLLAIPAMFNVVVPGDPLINLYQANHSIWWGVEMSGIYITRQGLKAALFLSLRVGISLSLGVLLITTTPVALLLKSLHVLRVPALFVMLIEMSYRYLVLLLNISIEMFEARRLRTVGNLSLAQQRQLVGSSVGVLFIKSMALAEEVYMAMQARCYTGEAVYFRQFQLHKGDWAWLVGLLIFIGFAVMGEVLVG